MRVDRALTHITYASENQIAVGEIQNGMTVQQEMQIPKAAKGIELRLATYMRQNEGSVFVKIVEKESGFILCEAKLDASAVEDNQFISFMFQHSMGSSSGNAVWIQMTSDSPPGQSITALIKILKSLKEY